MSWQDDVRRRSGDLGLTVTSGFRTPEHNAEIGGSPTSHHLEGTPSAPGAMDVSGPVAALRQFFGELRQAFAGRLDELYLNTPGSGFSAIKRNQPLARNPEAGRGQHLHISIGGQGGAQNIPEENRGQKALEATGEAGKRFCFTTLAGAVEYARRAVPGQSPDPSVKTQQCVYWSDVWFYAGGLAVALVGFVMLSGGRAPEVMKKRG